MDKSQFTVIASFVLLLMLPVVALADSIEIGRIDAPQLNSVTGMGTSTLCPGGIVWIIDGLGETMWKINPGNASVGPAFTLRGGPAVTHGLARGVREGHVTFFTHRRISPTEDALTSVNPYSGAVSVIGRTGEKFAHLSQTFVWRTNTLWLIADVNGGALYTVDTASGAGTLVRDYGGTLGRPTAMASGPAGELYVASLDGNIYRIFADRADVELVTTTGLHAPDHFTDFVYALWSGRWYAVEERSGVDPPEWHLREVLGLGGQCNPCDVNCDGEVNAFDIEPFLHSVFGECPCSDCAADANGDGRIDAFDIEPFVACLFE